MKYLFIIAIIFGISAVIFSAPEKHVNMTNTAEVSSVKIAKRLPKLLDLGSHKCIPCKQMEPILEKLKIELKEKLIVEFIDVGFPENREKAISYKIKYIPTQIFISKDELFILFVQTVVLFCIYQNFLSLFCFSIYN